MSLLKKHFMTIFSAAIIGLLAGACAPYAFKPETEQFARGIAAAKMRFDSTSDTILARRQALRDAERIEGKWPLGTTLDCVELNTVIQANAALNNKAELLRGCALQSAAGVVEPTPKSLQVEAALGPSRRVATALDAYAASLVQLTTAEDDAALRQGVSAIAASVAELGKSATLAGLDVPAISDEEVVGIAALLSELAKAGLEQRKLAVLRRVVTETDGSIEIVATGLAKIDEQQTRRLISQRLRRLEQARDATSKATNMRVAHDEAIAALAAYKASVAAYTPGKGPFIAATAAHGALRDALLAPADLNAASDLLDRLNALTAAARTAGVDI